MEWLPFVVVLRPLVTVPIVKFVLPEVISRNSTLLVVVVDIVAPLGDTARAIFFHEISPAGSAVTRNFITRVAALPFDNESGLPDKIVMVGFVLKTCFSRPAAPAMDVSFALAPCASNPVLVTFT